MRKTRTKGIIRIYCDGSGARPDGAGSSFGWLREDTGETHVQQVDRLTNNQAEYSAVLSALRALPPRSSAEIGSDSQIVCFQLSGDYSVTDPKLADLLTQIQDVIKRMHLQVTFLWVRRAQNLADKIIRRATSRRAVPRQGRTREPHAL